MGNTSRNLDFNESVKVLNSTFSSKKKKKELLDYLFFEYDVETEEEKQKKYDLLRKILGNITNRETLNLIGDRYASNILNLLFLNILFPSNIKMEMITNSLLDNFLDKRDSFGLLELLYIFESNWEFNDTISKLNPHYRTKVETAIRSLKTLGPYGFISNFSNDAIKYIVNNLDSSNIFSIAISNDTPKKVVDLILAMRTNDINDYIKSTAQPYVFLANKLYNFPLQILDSLIMRIPNNSLIDYLGNNEVSEEIKDRIFELRKDEITRIVVSDDDIFGKFFIGKYLDYLLKDKDENFIFNLFIKNSMRKKLVGVKYLLKTKGNIIKNYLYRNDLEYDDYWLRELFNLDYIWNDGLNELRDYLKKIIEINFIIDGTKDVNKIDKILEFDDEHIIGAFIRYSDNRQYRNLFANLYKKKKELFNNYFKLHPEDLTLLSYLPINFDDIKNILLEVPCLPCFISLLHKGHYGSLTNEMLIFLYDNNQDTINQYLELNPTDYFCNDRFFRKIANRISEENIMFFLFEQSEEEIEKRTGIDDPESTKEDVFTYQKDRVIKYLNEHPDKILIIPHDIIFYDFFFEDDILPQLNDNAIIKCFFNKKIIDDKLYADKDVASMLKLIFENKKSIIFEYLMNNNNWAFLLYYDIPIEDISNLIEKLDNNELLTVFLNLGNNAFDDKQNLLNIIFQKKKNFILDSFPGKDKRYSFILKLIDDDTDFNIIISKLDIDILNEFIANSNNPLDKRKKVISCLFLKENISIDDNLLDDFIFFWRSFINNGNYKFILNNFKEILYFFDECNLKFNKMFQYQANSDYNWIKGIMEIINFNNVNNFVNVKNVFFKSIFDITGNENDVLHYEALLILIENYNRYHELCKDIEKKKKAFSSDEKNKIMYLFNRNEKITIDSIEELSNINLLFREKFSTVISNLDEYDIDKLKEELSIIIFNNDYKTINTFLNVYGNREAFIKLKFDNRNNKEIQDYIEEMLVYVSLIEDFVNCNDLDSLKDIANNISNYFEEVSDISIIFNGLEKKMRNLFEMEANINLTDISNKEIYNKVLNKELSDKYGVDVLDFRDKQYLFYTHVKSDSESIEDLVKGKSTSDSNFISLSAIGNRNNRYYYGGKDGIKVLYSKIQKGSYIMSSVSNMSSNNLLSKNSTKVIETEREQRSLIDSVDAPGSNSEAIYYRDGLIPSGVNTYKGDRYFDLAVKTAKEYGLPIILTQGENRTITNPISLEEEKKTINYDNKDKYIELRKKLDKLINLRSKNSTRKIAILADSHALFEPTLAILEDARRQGITEIYSLGDNIGTGPNPGEVVDLLESYNVKSVKGNHELYTLLGTDQFKEHLHGTALKEAEENSNWTRLHLTDRQLEIIREYPDKIELNINGKKVLLTHYSKDLNTNKVIYDKDNYDKIFQGHIHHKKDEKNISTLRGVGIGSSNGEKGKAFYIVLTEKDGGGFDIEEKYVSFDINSLYHDINESSLPKHDKNKISSWTGASRR